MLLLGKGMMHYPTDQELALEKLFFHHWHWHAAPSLTGCSFFAVSPLFAPVLEFFLDKISFDNFSNVNKIIL